MKITELKTYTILFLLLTSGKIFPQELYNSDYSLNVQPYPKKVESLNRTLIIGKNFLPVYAENNEEKKARNYLEHILVKKISLDIHLSADSNENNWKIRLQLIDYKDSLVNDQYYSIRCSPLIKEIVISSPGQLGLLYGVVTFSKFVSGENEAIRLNLFNITDWPLYRRRGVCAVFNPDNVYNLLDYAIMNKIEAVAIASRVYPWFEIDNGYKKILEKIKSWKDRFGGPKIMQMHNIYDKKMIEISNPDDIGNLKKVIELGIQNGADELMILADDTPPFKFGEGYTLPDNNDKENFQSMAEAHCYLMQQIDGWIKSSNYNVELYYCPPFYTYEDMHYGDMDLYKNTPWEKDVFKPLSDYLNYIGLNMPRNVFIVWCGPNVRSRKITVEDLNNWTELLHGRVPFTWDNTIYSHFPFTSTPLFTAYKNDLPGDFYKLTAGNGIFLNGNANSEDTRVAAITANDYMWDPENYNPENSLNNAMENYYGKKYVKLLLDLKNIELTFRKKIGERKLYFEADTLWTVIREIRFITDKNPFYYHLNYSRLKALRFQLKNSVPEPVSKEEFIKECEQLDEKRNEIITDLKMINKEMAERIKSVISPLPDFNLIQ